MKKKNHRSVKWIFLELFTLIIKINYPHLAGGPKGPPKPSSGTRSRGAYLLVTLYCTQSTVYYTVMYTVYTLYCTVYCTLHWRKKSLPVMRSTSIPARHCVVLYHKNTEAAIAILLSGQRTVKSKIESIPIITSLASIVSIATIMLVLLCFSCQLTMTRWLQSLLGVL